MQQNEKPEEEEHSEESLIELEDIESLKETLAEEKAKAESHLQNWQRVQADFINFKRRSEQEKKEMKEFANSVLIYNLLPVLDDLERALSSVPKDFAGLPWVEGVRLIEQKFHDTLKAQGVTLIKAKGKPFDPNLHEAAMSIMGREGMVVKELKRGYKLHDRIIRPASVAVGSGEEKR